MELYDLKLGCGTVLTLSDLERAGISYVPCGQVDGKDQPLLSYSHLWGVRRQVTRASYGRVSNAWRLADMSGLQIMTGKPSYRPCDSSPDGFIYLTDIDIEESMVARYPVRVDRILEIYRSACSGTPCEIRTKSGGRLSAFVSYLDSKREFKDSDGKMLLELFSEKGLSRLDSRYSMVSGSVLDPPVLPKSALQKIHAVISEIAVEHARESRRDCTVVSESQLAGLDRSYSVTRGIQ